MQRRTRLATILCLFAGLSVFSNAWGQAALKQRISPALFDLYSFVNPFAPVCESYRRILVYGHAPEWRSVGFAAASTALLLAFGYWTFKKLEPGFADVA